MDLEMRDFNYLKRKMYEREVRDITEKTPAEQYVDFVFKQEQCLKDIENAMKKITDENIGANVNALVGVIRIKSEIHDKVLKRGEELGVIQKADAGGLDEELLRLSERELKDMVTQELRALKELERDIKLGLDDYPEAHIH